MNGNATIGFGEAPEVAVGIGIADNPGILSSADGVDEVVLRESSGFGEHGVGAVDGHLCIPLVESFIEAVDDFRILFGKVVGFARVFGEIVELGGGAINIDEVFPVSIADSEVGVVFIKPVTEAGAVRRTSPEDGCLARGVGLSDESLGKVFAIEFFGGFCPGQGVEGAVKIDGGEDGGVVGGVLSIIGDKAGSPDDEG